MSIRSIAYLKDKFKTGKVPTETDYGDALDTFLPRDEYSAPRTEQIYKYAPGDIEENRVSLTTSYSWPCIWVLISSDKGESYTLSHDDKIVMTESTVTIEFTDTAIAEKNVIIVLR